MIEFCPDWVSYRVLPILFLETHTVLDLINFIFQSVAVQLHIDIPQICCITFARFCKQEDQKIALQKHNLKHEQQLK